MSEAIVEQIAQNIVGTLEDMVIQGEPADALELTELNAVRPKRGALEDDARPQDGTVVVIQGDPSLDEANSAQGNRAMKAWRQPFALVVFVINDDSNSNPIDRRINAARAQVEAEMMKDRSRGGHAIDTEIQPPQRFNSGDGATGIVVMIEVFYRTREDDPFNTA